MCCGGLVLREISTCAALMLSIMSAVLACRFMPATTLRKGVSFIRIKHRWLSPAIPEVPALMPRRPAGRGRSNWRPGIVDGRRGMTAAIAVERNHHGDAACSLPNESRRRHHLRCAPVRRTRRAHRNGRDRRRGESGEMVGADARAIGKRVRLAPANHAAHRRSEHRHKAKRTRFHNGGRR